MFLNLLKCLSIVPSLPSVQSHQWLLFGRDRPEKALFISICLIKDGAAVVGEKQSLTGPP